MLLKRDEPALVRCSVAPFEPCVDRTKGTDGSQSERRQGTDGSQGYDGEHLDEKGKDSPEFYSDSTLITHALELCSTAPKGSARVSKMGSASASL